MKNISDGGVCSVNRIKITAQEFETTKGPVAFATFLRSVAGVSNVADVPEDERFRVNAALRAELNSEGQVSPPPLHRELARIGARAFAKMRVQR